VKYSVIQLSSVSRDKQRKIAMKGEKLMAVIGAVLGDIAGSQFEFNRPENLDYKHCELFTNRCSYTDDTIMTLAVKKAILENADFTKTMREIGQPYPYSGYGGRFYE
jgi:ADP-ribosylglycohydrolase